MSARRVLWTVLTLSFAAILSVAALAAYALYGNVG